MSGKINQRLLLPFVNILLVLAVAGVIVGLTAKTFYDVMTILRSSSAANYYYREAFNLQMHWRLAIDKLGPLKSCSPEMVIGANGRILIGETAFACESGGRRFIFPIPDEFTIRPEWDAEANLAILRISRSSCAEPPLRLAAVIDREVDHERK